MPIRVTIWNEFRYERERADIKAIYPDGLHVAIADGIRERLGDDVAIRYAALDDPEHGVSDEVLADTDVLIWWAHGHHPDVRDEVALRVAQRVRAGMGFIPLHSAHYAKPLKLLLGTNAHLTWRDEGERERIWLVSPGHPISAGLSGDSFVIPVEEMYGEPFDIPTPDELVFVSWFEGGEVFRSGCVWKRGAGRIFFFRPGHEKFPTYFQPEVRQIIANAVRYCAPSSGAVAYRDGSPRTKPSLEPIGERS